MGDPPFIQSATEPDIDSIAIIAQALIEKFGDQARHSAEGPLFSASPESKGIWLEVVTKLTRDKTASDD